MTALLQTPRAVLEHGIAELHARTGVGHLAGSPRDAILMYHAVGEDPAAGYFGAISADRFRESIAYVAENAEIVPLADIVRRGDGRRVAITFDDGLRSFYTEALPILEEYGVPVTVFVNPAFVDDRNRALARARHGIDDSGRLMLSDDELLDLVEHPLVRVGNHTLTHRELTAAVDETTLHAEIVDSKHRLEDRYGVTTELFSYPHGASCERSRALVEDLHDVSVTTNQFLLDGNRSHHLPRIWAHKPHRTFEWELSRAGDRVNRFRHRVANI